MSESDDQDSLPWAIRDGKTIRFELRIPSAEAHHWFDWARRDGNVPHRSYIGLGIPVATPEDPEFVNQWNQGSKHWYVIERPIGSDEWVKVVDIETGAALWPLAGSSSAPPDDGGTVKKRI
ncbi:hypothetical protein C0216_08660 [Streptomyces globosus]|uniref:Uncharacterized protein n=1 Tax=Streptomyces globosus TaxID=68209 RepID=A0A344TY02_9ACTN|nr:hypothetical protein [Streptomyces globosus]AXE23523.1 hypothetical protein C0216_08660 [Streptomyces globosus]